MPANPYSIADDLQSQRPPRAPEKVIGVIASEPVRWTDAIWTYDVELENTGRMVPRVREHVPPYYQSGAGLRQIGDRVSLQRVSRTLWEIVADESTPASWPATGSQVYLETSVRLNRGGGETERKSDGWLQFYPGFGWFDVRRYLGVAADHITDEVSLVMSPILGTHLSVRTDRSTGPGLSAATAPGLLIDAPYGDHVRLRSWIAGADPHAYAVVDMDEDAITVAYSDTGDGITIDRENTRIRLALHSGGDLKSEIIMGTDAITLTAEDTVITIDDGGLTIADPGGGVSGDAVLALAALPDNVDAELTHKDTQRTTASRTDPTGRSHSHSYDDESLDIGRIYLRRTGANAIPIQDSPSLHVDG